MRDQTMDSMSRLYPVVWFQRHRWASNIVEFVAALFSWLGQLLSWILAWFLNQCVSIILMWWFKVYHVTARADAFGFCVARGVKLRWNGIPDIDVEKLVIKIEWDLWNFRIPSLTFHVKKLRSELFTNLKDAKADTLFSFTLKWTIIGLHPPHTMVIPALDNIQNFHSVMTILTCLKATNAEIVTEFFHCKTMSVMSVILCKLESLDFMLIKSCHGTTLQIRLLDVSCFCDCFDPNYYQVRQNKIAGVPCIDVAVAWPRIGPCSVCVNCVGVRAILSPKNIGNVLIDLGRLLDTDAKAKGSTEEKIIDESESGQKGPVHHSQIVLKVHDIAVLLMDMENNDRGRICVSFDLSSDKWQRKTTYKGCIGVEASFHGIEQVSRDPCVILGNETISRPWTCSFTGSDVRGQCTIISINSEDFLSLVLRPACVQALSNLHKDFQLSLDQVQLQTTLMSLKARVNKLSTQRQVFVELNGANVFLEMDVYEQVLGLSLDKLKVEFEQDQDQLSFELTLNDIEVEDSIHGITAFQFLRSNERNLSQMLTFSVVKDLQNTDETRVYFKHLKATVGDLSVCLEEPLLLKLLQFCGVKHREQLWRKREIYNASVDGERGRPVSTLANTSFFFENVEVSSFVSVSTMTPAKELSDDLQQLKETLEIPQGLPPTVDKMRVEFGGFLRTGIRYKSMEALVRDVRMHYLKEIGRQSGKVLGSLHIFGNVSALKKVIGSGLAELQETGDYVGFAGLIKGGLADSYYKFADSWPTTVKKTPNNTRDCEDVSTRYTSMERRESLVHSIAGNLASGIGSWIFRSSTDDTCQERPQASSTPVRRCSSAVLTRSPSGCKRRLITGDQESSSSEDSSLSCPASVEDWELVPGSSVRKAKGQEFLKRLKLSLGDSTPNETFECCSKLRRLNPDEKLNALITSHVVYLLKGKSPDVENVVLKVELNRLYKTQYKAEGDAHYLELLMRMAGVNRLCLPSPNPADSPLVQCDTAELAQKAARKINEAKKNYEKANYR